MSNQLVCDKCLQTIDPTKPYFTLAVTKMQIQSGGATGVAQVVGETKNYDFHDNHLPKIIDAAPASVPK